jgi:pimeloyl-ACP methyl ester carboxylesterase
VEGNGPPLVLHHGFSGSLELWRQFGYVEALHHAYQRILLDARGHGASDKPYSMGGWIGFGVAKYAPERVHALLLGGAHPYADYSWDAFREVNGRDPEAFVAALESGVAQRIPPEFKPRVLANDLQALAAAAKERPALEDVLPTMTMPCLLFVGEADARYPAVLECAKHMAHATLAALFVSRVPVRLA